MELISLSLMNLHILVYHIRKDSQDLYGDRELYISQIGPTIGTHIGPGAIGVAFFKNK